MSAYAAACEPDLLTNALKPLTDDEKHQLAVQDSRLVPAHKAIQLEQQAQRHWDLFYKRNETRFFKDRRWTTREFEELLFDDGVELQQQEQSSAKQRRLLEIGCGVGNLIFPLVEAPGARDAYFFYACDFSPRAIEFVRQNPLYEPSHMLAFQCDITDASAVFQHIDAGTLDICTLVFVLSAIHPERFAAVLEHIYALLAPGGVLLFRDYGRYDMAQLRFKAGHKIAENLYMRQDGTRSYYFADGELAELARGAGFRVLSNGYVHRRTVNVKEGVDAPRIFLQGKFVKD